MSLSSLLNRTITIQRRVITKDSHGGQSRTWDPISGAEGIKAAIQPASSSVKSRYAQRLINITHNIYLDRDTGVANGDRVVDSDGTIYVVRGFGDSGGRGRLYHILVKVQH